MTPAPDPTAPSGLEARLRDLLYISLAGGVGASARYLVSNAAYRLLGDRFAWGTLAVNALGSLLLGFVMAIALGSDWLPRPWRVAITIGFMGAFTTFSTFSYETFRYLMDGDWRSALANLAAQLVLGLVAVGGGWALGRALL